MYKNTKWRDRVVDANTQEIIQEGTHMSAENFNNMENGITDAHLAFALMQIMFRNKLDLCKIAVFEGELAANSTVGKDLPDGFTADNCCVVSVMYSENGNSFSPDNTGRILVTLHDGKCGISNSRTDMAVFYKVAVQKYK